MADTREVEKWTLLHGELVQEDDGPLVWSEDYDTLAVKLAEVEEMKRLLAMDKINLRGELAGVQGKLAAANDQLDSARHSVTVLEGRADHFKARAEAAEQRVATLEAALPAVYRLALGDAAERLLAAVTREYKDHRDYRNAIRALPTPTAEELMARIQTGEKE
jgi:chromosome segregation ATPase